jgi:hypothetical protein
MLPRIVPPIDREYTLWYLFGNKTIKNDLEGEWELMKIVDNLIIGSKKLLEISKGVIQPEV